MFWFRENKRKNSKKYTPRKRVTLDDAFEQAVVHKAQKDKDWALNKALKKMGLEDEDPVKRQEQEIKATLVSEALKRIKSDPELLQQFTEKQVEKLVGGVSITEGEDAYLGSPLEQVLQDLENMDALKEKLGAKGGAFGGLVNAETITEILKTIRSMGGRGITEAPPERTWVVEVNGQPTEVTEPQYRQLEQAGKLRPVAALEAPKQPPKTEEVEETRQGIEPEPEVPEFIVNNLDMLAGYLELSPEEFVDELLALQIDSSEYSFVWNFLLNAAPEKIVEIIEPYREHSIVGAYVEKLLSDEGKVWIEGVMELMKEQGSG